MATFVRRNACPVCAATDVELIADIPFADPKITSFLDRRHGTTAASKAVSHASYRIAACRKCECVYQQDILDDAGMVELYDQWVPADRSLAKKAAAPASFFLGYMEDLLVIERLLSLPSHQIDLLDFGMGWGFWARMAKALNFRVVGAELSQARIDFASTAGISVTTDVRALPDESFHAISADQVFEHLPEPADTMAELARLLKPGGLVMIKVPHDNGVLENLLSPSFEPRHDALHPLQHINMYRRGTFDALGAVAGLEQIQAPITVSPLNGKAWLSAIRRRRRNARHQSTALYRKPFGSSTAEGGFRSGGRPRRQARPAPDLHTQGASDPRGQS